MSFSDGPALLRSVLDDPRDDAPRLAYADWCMEHGREARGEFIHVQCALERTPQSLPPGQLMTHDTESYRHDALLSGVRWRISRPGEPYVGVSSREMPNPEWKALKKREAELDADHMSAAWHLSRESQAEWGVDGLWGVTRVTWRWRRGFIWRAESNLKDWHAHSGRLLARHPVQEVALTHWPGDLEGFVQTTTMRDAAPCYHHPLWPKITFVLPHLTDPRRTAEPRRLLR